MKRFFRLCLCEFQKLRRTPILHMHLIVPAAGLCAILLYYQISTMSSLSKVQVWLECLSALWPLLCGILCGMAAEAEEDGGYQTFFVLPARKFHALLAKWLVLLILGLFSALLAVLGFGLLFQPGPEADFLTPLFYLRAALILWAGQIIVYLIHLFFSFQWGKTASIAVGSAGLIFSLLMLTGLGNARWMFFPYSWSSRLGDYLLLYTAKGSESAGFFTEGLQAALFICGAVAVLLTAAIFFWFAFYEGRRQS